MVLGGPFREKKRDFLILLEILRINENSAKFLESCGIPYFLWEKHFPIPYNLKRIVLYLLVMLSIYLVITITDINMWINSLYLIAFIILIFILEKPKKIVFSNPKLFN